MRIATTDGRVKLVVADRVVDVEHASSGRLSAEPSAALQQWNELRTLAESLDAGSATSAFDDASAGPLPVTPTQVFGIALNYGSHADESGIPRPTSPSTFTKFPSCLTGGTGQIRLPSERVDWEVELVVVIGRQCERVAVPDAWGVVAGLTVGQDITERELQFTSALPQFSLSKSFAGFGPMGPVLVTPDEFDDPDDLELGCSINGQDVQRGRTNDLIFSVPEIVSYLSRVVTLLPGDVIFTGTPAGIGNTRTPPRFLQPGDELASFVEGVGTMRHTMAAGPSWSPGP